ncbi:hypothetical protein Tco_0951915 [Tanacetum coccineum]|uniref:Uncharacterized protein n=1 Tax=Tanacetum coccineum TaxID=301880 RepID=A0ABQ5DVK9_9ASTR
MDFMSFMMGRVDGEFNFLPEGCLNNDESSPSAKFMNNEALMVDIEPITTIHPSKFAKNISDYNDAPSENDEAILIGASSKNLEEFPSAKELKDSFDCHWVVAHVTPPSWKQHLKEISLEKLYDIHDKAYMRQVVLDNMLNNRIRKLMSTLSKELIRSDEMGLLIARLVKVSMFHGRCAALEDVANLKEPFALEKMPGYRSSLKEEFDRVNDKLANASSLNKQSFACDRGLRPAPSFAHKVSNEDLWES